MPFCPNCKYEYRDGFKKCSDCGTDLVDELPEHEEVKVKLVPLKTQPGRIYSEMVKEVLEKKGIFCIIESGPLFSLGSAGSEGDESYILVQEDRYEEAEKILEEMSGDL
ncbi:putative signal transducing protein [candidate division KSB1 bacterium]